MKWNIKKSCLLRRLHIQLFPDVIVVGCIRIRHFTLWPSVEHSQRFCIKLGDGPRTPHASWHFYNVNIIAALWWTGNRVYHDFFSLNSGELHYSPEFNDPDRPTWVQKMDGHTDGQMNIGMGADLSFNITDTNLMIHLNAKLFTFRFSYLQYAFSKGAWM